MAERRARVADVHEIAASMPHVTRIEGPKGNAIYQVGGKSFVFFRTPQPDAQDPDTGVPDLDTLATLKAYRDDVPTTEPLPFGVHASVLEPGRVRIGDEVAVT